jgi:D-sedoheptulose 7-phosphate isomerase
LKNIWYFANVLAATFGHPNIRNAEKAIEVIFDALGKGKPLLVCRNGGSAFEVMHITGELVGRLLKSVGRSIVFHYREQQVT